VTSPPTAEGKPDAGRDERTVRRGLLAALATTAVIAGGGVLTVVLRGAGGAAGLAVVLLGLAIGSLVGSGWLLLAAALDTRAGQPISGRRWAWTVGLCLAAIVLLVLAPAALVAPAA